MVLFLNAQEKPLAPAWLGADNPRAREHPGIELQHQHSDTAELKLNGTVGTEIPLQAWDKALRGKTGPVSSVSLTEPGPAHYLCHGL